MRVVAALGGNALLERGEPPDSDIQEAHILRAVNALAPLARTHCLVITHGNGRRPACWRWRAPATRYCRIPTRSTCSGRRPRG